MLSGTSRLFSQLSSEDRAHSSMTLAPINFERRLLARFGSSKNDANGGKAKLLRITKLNKEAYEKLEKKVFDVKKD